MKKPAAAHRRLLPIADGTRLIDVVRTLDEAGIDAIDINRREATLDDVFLTVTADADDASHTAPLEGSPR